MASSNVALVTNYFATPNEGFSTTLNGTISPTAASVPLNSTAGLVNGTIFVGIIEPGTAKEQTFTGTVDTGTGAITNVKWTRGNDVSHTGGVVIVDYVTGTTIKMIITGVLKHANQDGSLKQAAVITAIGSSGALTAAAIAAGYPANKLSNPYKFSAYNNATLPNLVGSGTVVGARLNAVVYDTGSNFDTTNYRFVVPVNGFYQFNFAMSVNTNASNGYISTYITVIRSGSPTIDYKCNEYAMSTVSGVTTSVGSKALSLLAGDYVTIKIGSAGASGPLPLAGDTFASQTWFDGFLISAT